MCLKYFGKTPNSWRSTEQKAKSSQVKSDGEALKERKAKEARRKTSSAEKLTGHEGGIEKGILGDLKVHQEGQFHCRHNRTLLH